MTKMGRPTVYTEDMANRICEGLTEGKSLITVLKENPDTPTYTTVMQWLKDKPDFADKYRRAREHQADHDADKIGEIAQKVITGELDPNAARVAIEAYKWAAGKRKPKVYGEKLALGGSDDMAPIRTTNQLDVSGLSLEELEALGAALQKTIGKG